MGCDAMRCVHRRRFRMPSSGAYRGGAGDIRMVMEANGMFRAWARDGVPLAMAMTGGWRCSQLDMFCIVYDCLLVYHGAAIDCSRMKRLHQAHHLACQSLYSSGTQLCRYQVHRFISHIYMYINTPTPLLTYTSPVRMNKFGGSSRSLNSSSTT